MPSIRELLSPLFAFNPGLLVHGPHLLRFPQLVPKLALNYFNLVVRRRDVLRSVDVSVTFDCQCLCEHCYSDYEKDPGRQRLTVREMKHVIDQCLDLGAVVLNFAGGEPLVEPNLFEYLDHVKPHRGLTTMMTNAIRLTPEVARELGRVRLYAMGVSVDSDDPDVHDRSRRYKGAHEKALEGIQNARAAGILVMMNSIVTQEKIDDGTISRLHDLAAEEKLLLNLCFPAAVGRQARFEPEALRPDSARWIEELLRKPHVRWDGQSNWMKEGCGAGIEKISISTYGDVIPCAVIQSSFGNLRERPLSEIWSDMKRIRQYAELGPVCLASRDSEFHDKYMTRINKYYEEHGVLPAPASVVYAESTPAART